MRLVMISNTILVPPISDQELLAKYYSLADVFVICSKRENFPTTCIEAQCCGTPVIGFDTGGTKETALYFPDGFVNYGDMEQLKERLNKALNVKAAISCKRAQKEYSKESMFTKYVNEYDKNGRKERILLIDVNCKYSSTGKIVYDLYQNIKKDGREAAICYGRGKKLDEEAIFKFGIDAETVIHAGLSRLTGYNGVFSPLSTVRLLKYIDAFKPDLIHIHELHAYFVNIKPLLEYIKQKRIPVVWTFHCEYMYTGKCGHAYECLKYQNECHDCPAVKEYPKSLLWDKTRQMFKMKKKLLKNLDFTIVTPSKWLADRVRTSFLKDKEIKVIHNGIDINIFHPLPTVQLRRELGIPESYKVVLAVAPNIMSKEKGGEWVLKLADMMKNKKIIFILIGV